ncbi:ArsR/SmtB family transcription factor, partial [Couchioplanes caeruleus]
MTAAVGAGMTPAVALFRSLGDETRLRIVQRLAAGEARVVDLTGELGLAQSTVSKHLACLRDCGLIDFRVQGRQSFYALTRPELLDLLAAAEGLLAATGTAVALCPDGSSSEHAALRSGVADDVSGDFAATDVAAAPAAAAPAAAAPAAAAPA